MEGKIDGHGSADGRRLPLLRVLTGAACWWWRFCSGARRPSRSAADFCSGALPHARQARNPRRLLVLLVGPVSPLRTSQTSP